MLSVTAAAMNTAPNATMRLYDGTIAGPLLRQVVAQRLAQLGAEDDREQDRRDPEQATNDALRVADDEHRQQRQEDDQVERLDAVPSLGFPPRGRDGGNVAGSGADSCSQCGAPARR